MQCCQKQILLKLGKCLPFFKQMRTFCLPILHEMQTFKYNKNKAHLNHHLGDIVTQVKTDIIWKLWLELCKSLHVWRVLPHLYSLTIQSGHFMVFLRSLGENAHFFTPMWTKWGLKYKKSLHCRPNAHFADLFGNTGLCG